MENYHVLQQVGEGSFGKVYKGRRKYCGQVVALKFLPKHGRADAELLALRRELDILRTLRHPNIVQMLDCFETEDALCAVTEFASGTLFEVLQGDTALPEAAVLPIAAQLVDALHYLHSHRVIHRDMKPQNILLGANSAQRVARSPCGMQPARGGAPRGQPASLVSGQALRRDAWPH